MEYEDAENAESCKVVLLGASGVGKTSIIAQYIDQEFSEDQPSTTGATFGSKTMYLSTYDKSISFEIWDTAGQERFKSLAKMFYKDASIVILVYDITRIDSFQEIEEYWINQVKEHAPKKIIIAIAANKSDLYDQEIVDEKKVRKFAEEIGALFMYTSAKNSKGIEELFTEVGNRFCDPNYAYSEEALEESERMKKSKTNSTKISSDAEINESPSEKGTKDNMNSQTNKLKLSNKNQTQKKKKNCC